MKKPSFVATHRPLIVFGLGLVALGLSGVLFAHVPGGRVAFLLCGIGATGALVRL